MQGWVGKVAFTTVLAGLAVTFTAYQLWKPAEGATTAWKFAQVERGSLQVAISSTGTLEPEEVIDVGAQVAGKVQEFGKDADGGTIDYGSPVESGTVLARIDPAIFEQEVNLARAMLAKSQARLHQSRAEIQATQAAVARAEADLATTRVKLDHSERDFARTKRLTETKVVTQEQFDLQQATVDTTRTAITSAEAALAQAKSAVVKAQAAAEEAQADVESSEASLKRAQQNLDYTTIRSPIKGVIIDRRVNIGQTVVASLNAPSLFLIAKDLSRLQVWASVNEADIGRLHPGQRVTFQVDAFPTETFIGQVKQIRLNASMTQNVVTYTVVVDVENEGNKLLPYLTANVKFEVAEHRDVLIAPNAALNWKPKRGQIATAYRDAPPPRTAVWTREGDGLRPIEVKVLDTDGASSALEGEGLRDGLEIIVGESRAGSGGESVNPLLPQMFSKKKG